MLAREMQISFINQISAISQQLEVPDMIDSDTIFYWINYAQQKYLKEMYVSKQSAKENVEFIQRRLEDLKQLLVRKVMFKNSSQLDYVISSTGPSVNPITPATPFSSRVVCIDDGAVGFPLPTDYFYYVKSSSQVSGTYLQVSNLTWIDNMLIEHEEPVTGLSVNAINTPIIRNPYILLESSPTTTDTSKSYMFLYKDSYTNLWNVMLSYIRTPKKIVLTVTDSTTQTNTCELAFQTHQDIVDYSVKLYIEDFKYKLSSKQATK